MNTTTTFIERWREWAAMQYTAGADNFTDEDSKEYERRARWLLNATPQTLAEVILKEQATDITHDDGEEQLRRLVKALYWDMRQLAARLEDATTSAVTLAVAA